MKKLLLAFLFVLSILPSMATDWIPNANGTLFYDRDSIRVNELGIYSVKIKNLPTDDKETVMTFQINCKAKRFNHSESALYDINKQRNVYRQFIKPNWGPIPQNSNIDYICGQICH